MRHLNIIFLFICILLFGCTSLSFIESAAQKGDIQTVRQYFNNSTPKERGDALVLAAGNGNLDVVKFLVENGVDIEWRNYRGATALSLAASNGHMQVVQYLVEKGADLNASDIYGGVPLTWPAYNNHFAVVKYLIEKGASIDAAIASLESPAVVEVPEDNKVKGGIRLLEGYKVRTKTEPVKEPAQVVASRDEMQKKKEERTISVKSDVDELPAVKAKPNKNAYAIVIGIEEYRQKLPKADFAAHDAQTIAEYLTKVMGYPEENVVTLINDRAAKSDFEKYFEKWLWNNVEKDGVVFIYYSGHGAPNPKTGDAYLVPYDGDPAFIDQTGYSLKRLYDNLGKLQTKEIIVALDSCFSGAGGRSVIAKGAKPLIMNLENDITPVKNMTVLSASSGDQISSAYEEKGHGLFTYFMLKGIKDGITEIGELFDYMKPQVERVARKTYNNEQSPQLIVPEKKKVFLIEKEKGK